MFEDEQSEPTVAKRKPVVWTHRLASCQMRWGSRADLVEGPWRPRLSFMVIRKRKTAPYPTILWTSLRYPQGGCAIHRLVARSNV